MELTNKLSKNRIYEQDSDEHYIDGLNLRKLTILHICIR